MKGLIISPVNVAADRISDRIPDGLMPSSWLDPQFYLPHDSKSKLSTYPFFPGNVLDEFNATDFEDHALEVAKACLAFQSDLGLRYLVIPTRYFDDLPDDYLQQLRDLFVDPFVEAGQDLGLEQPLMLTVLAKPIHLERGDSRDELLTWATGFADVGGVYLILDHSSPSKQIKDPQFLVGALRFIRAIRANDLDVHVGYAGLEGLLFSVADPTSVTVGSYENLRSFGTVRLETRERTDRRGPRPRIYSGRLLQWIEETFVPPMRELVPDWRQFFDDSPYKSYLLDPESSLNFQRSELYKHYFYVFSQQVESLPDLDDRPDYVRGIVRAAMEAFAEISEANVFLDSDSDGSHLAGWLNALAMFEANPE